MTIFDPKDKVRKAKAEDLMTELLSSKPITAENFLIDVMDVPSVNNSMTVYSAYFCPSEKTL